MVDSRTFFEGRAKKINDVYPLLSQDGDNFYKKPISSFRFLKYLPSGLHSAVIPVFGL